MTKYKFFLLFLSITLFGCQENTVSKQNSLDKPVQTKVTIEQPIAKVQTKFQCSRIIVSIYDNNTPPSQSYKDYGPFSTELICETKDQKILDLFEQMTKQGEKT